MPRAKPTTALASLIESDSEPDLDFFDVTETQPPQSNKLKEPMAAIKKPRGRPAAANRIAKPASKSTRRTSGRIAAAAEALTREVLADKSNLHPPRVFRKAEKQIQDTIIAPPPTKSARGRPKAGEQPRMENSKGSVLQGSVAKPRGRRTARNQKTEIQEIPETQPDDWMVVEAEVEAEVEEIEEQADLTASLETVDPTVEFDMCDVSIRRRLGDVTTKYQKLQARHQDLQQVGVKEAERNFERLQKESAERTKVALSLIQELKGELVVQTVRAKQGDGFKKQLEDGELKIKDLQAEIETLNASLAEAKSEIKTLSTKLAASRSTEANSRVPGSALKTSALGHRATLVQAKEDLYGDLTGLIMRDVRRDEMEDVFDCIQTGRNGTLHFKLVVETTDKACDYEEMEFTYKPQLDSSRDEALIEMLPDYLVEEITFPRPQASKFYARVIKSMTERVN